MSDHENCTAYGHTAHLDDNGAVIWEPHPPHNERERERMEAHLRRLEARPPRDESSPEWFRGDVEVSDESEETAEPRPDGGSAGRSDVPPEPGDDADSSGGGRPGPGA